MKDWLTRWRLKRIIAALSRATEFGLREGVINFAEAMSITHSLMAGEKQDKTATITVKRKDLTEFITYMTRLHNAKLSLLQRARIGLATLTMSAEEVLGESPEDLINREKPKAQSGRRIHIIK